MPVVLQACLDLAFALRAKYADKAAWSPDLVAYPSESGVHRRSCIGRHDSKVTQTTPIRRYHNKADQAHSAAVRCRPRGQARHPNWLERFWHLRRRRAEHRGSYR